MNVKRNFQNESADWKTKIAIVASFKYLPGIIIAGQFVVFWFSKQEHLFPDNDALMTVISCCAQIIAGLYGITLAGYTFFSLPHGCADGIGCHFGLHCEQYQAAL